jgi:hypothetical protein
LLVVVVFRVVRHILLALMYPMEGFVTVGLAVVGTTLGADKVAILVFFTVGHHVLL